VDVRILGVAKSGSREIRREAVPTEDMMQAFLYQHLAPVRELSVAVRGSASRPPEVSLLKNEPVTIPAGGSAVVLLKTPPKVNTKSIRLALSNAPEGISLQKTSPVDGGLTLTLAADGQQAKAGLADNLFVEAFSLVEVKNKNGKPTGETRRNTLGFLPAIPFNVVNR
jgi:hypothetical protein